jgi:glucokinase
MSLFVGFDIGGTSIKHMLIDSSYTVLHTGSFETLGPGGPDEALDTMISIVHSYEAQEKQKVQCVGIGCTGPVNIYTGSIQNPYTLPGFEGKSLKDRLAPTLGIPVLVENDANTAHVGEIHYCGITQENTMMITFGTGVGVSLRMKGELFRTPGGIHPEIGHMTVSVSSPGKCYCSRTNCFEHVLSGTAINAYATATYGMTPEAILEGEDKGKATEFLDRLVTATTDAISTLAMIFSSELVILGGGMHQFIGNYILPPVQDRLDDMLPVYGRTTLVEARYGALSGSYGAAVMAAHTMQNL